MTGKRNGFKSESKDELRIALIQMDTREDKRANLETARRFAGEAADRQADLILFPERMEYIGADLPNNASDPKGETTQFFGELAREHGVYLMGGITEKLPGIRQANTSLLFGPQGNLLASYRKLHMFDVDIAGGPVYRESDEIERGGEIVVARTRLADFGFAICYDLRFGEMFRLMAKAGAQVMLLPANFTRETGRAHWEVLLRARAIENGCYVAACNQTGEKDAFAAYGNSMLIDPWGQMIARAGEEPGVITADVDLRCVKKARRQIPSLENIREDIYRLESCHMKIYEE